MDQEKTIEEIIKSLEPKQKLFVEIYVGSLNGAEAARLAGYSEKGAKENASRLLTYDNVAAYKDHLLNERSKKLGVTAEDLLSQLDAFRRAKISDYVELVTLTYKKDGIDVSYQELKFKDWKDLTEEQISCIESVKKGVHGIELKLQGKDWSIEKCAKHINFYKEDNTRTLETDKPFEITFSTDESND
jgi:hypothetical protein